MNEPEHYKEFLHSLNNRMATAIAMFEKAAMHAVKEAYVAGWKARGVENEQSKEGGK